jgi:DNA invertase Pin-like site-specific DNA recombinase
MQLDGYVRVSRTAGRDGESFISPQSQRDAIQAYAAANGWTIAAWHEDLDQTGANLERPGFQAALARCRNAETDGIIAAKLDRLSRSLVGLANFIDEAKRDRWHLVAVDFGLDVKTASGRLVADILGAVAEWELEQRRQGWNEAQGRAVARGIHVASRTPTGYRRREEDGRLEPDPAAIATIRELFRRRARGEGWTALARFLDVSGVRGPYSNAAWTPTAVAKMLRNPVYLGEARSGRHVNRAAHKPLVTRAEWEAAQGNGRTVSTPRNGDGLLLSGLVRCAACRYLMKPDTMRGRDGSRLGLYRCRVRHAAGLCSAPATVMARLLDPHIENVFLDALGPDGPLAEASQATGAIDGAALRVDEAARELDEYLAANLISVIGAERFRAGLEQRQEALDAARCELADTRQASAFSDALNLTPGRLREAWPALSTAERRHLLAASIDAVVIRAVRGSGRTVQLDERALVLWRGQAPDDFPGRGRRVPLQPFPWPNERPADVRVAGA